MVIASVSAPSIRQLLYGVEPLDPVVMLLVPFALAVACVIACVVRRDGRCVDPVVALRAE
jgi:hypothetical protein